MPRGNIESRIWANKTPWSREVEIRYGQDGPRGTVLAAQPAVMVEHPSGQPVSPVLIISERDAQALLSSLWQEGFRPQDNTGSTGHIKALEDTIAAQKEIINKLFLELSHR